MTGLSLNRWFELMGWNPWHGFQLANTLVPVTAACDTVLYQQAWQRADRVGRVDLYEAIERAEQLVFQYAHRWPSPRYREATLAFPRPGNRALDYRASVDPQGRWFNLILDEGHIQASGVMTETGSSTALLTYTDQDGDGLFETATTTAPVPAGTLPAEVLCRFLASDCGPVTPRPTIEPRTVSVIGTTATITFDTWTLVRPVRTSGAAAAPLDPSILPPVPTSPFAASLEVLRQRCDPTGTTTDTAQALLIWESRPCPAWACCATTPSTDPAATATALARVGIRDAAAGVVTVGDAVYNATTGQWTNPCDWCTCYPPDRVTIRYQAGLALDNGAMQANEAHVVARLAAAELGRPVCACAPTNKAIYEWQKDLSQIGGTDDLYASPDDITNPLGARRGHVFAWRHIQQQQRTIGIYAG